MNGEKCSIYDDQLDFKSSGKIFALKCVVLKMFTDYYDFNTPDSLHAKLIIKLMAELGSDKCARSKKSRRQECNKKLLQN